MKFRRLGRTGVQVSEIGLGTWKTFDVRGAARDAHCTRIAGEVIRLGGNFFDTAPGYGEGRSEEVLGTALIEKRHSSIIGTKVPPSDLSPKNIRKACEDSLKRLKTDYIDLYQLHWPERNVNNFGKLGYEHKENNWNQFEDVLGELKKYIDIGKIRYVGL